MSEQDFFWLVGLLEGEGTFLKGPPSAPNQPRIAVNMTDEDTVQRIASLFGVGYIHTRRHERHDNWKPAFTVKVVGKPAMELMRQIQPHMSKRRQEQIQRALDSYDPKYKQDRPNAPKLTEEQVKELRASLAPFDGKRLPRGMLTDLANKYEIARRNVHKIRVGAAW